jgi:precorrin-8X/cobalt-precorrin-8 methylmutase
MTPLPDYLRDGEEIYRRSFAIIRAEADLGRFTAEEAEVAVRMIHAAGRPAIARDLCFHPLFVARAKEALTAGRPVFCDSRMLAAGIIRRLLPAANPVICTLDDPRSAALAARLGTTRSAAALELWGEALAGAVVAVGNAPTALFHLLERLEAGWPAPAAVIGLPVGFVGAAESKAALAARGTPPFLVLSGREGGSAMAAAALNALARLARGEEAP